ncbi:MAG: lamin tail domain-containing protein [Flavobacteriales bacterium]
MGGRTITAIFWVCPLGLFGQWTTSGDLEDWIQLGETHWKLNASSSGSAALVIQPNFPFDSSEGVHWSIRWSQDLQGSASNFSRIHWLTDSGAINASTWTPEADEAPGSFLHLGESGVNDSIRWFETPSPNSLINYPVLSPTTNSQFPQKMNVVIDWRQPPNDSAATLTITPIDSRWDPIEYALSEGIHEIPLSIGFSASFTSSNTEQFEIEILHYGPYQPDTLPPKISTARYEELGAMGIIRWKFDEPLHPSNGQITSVQGDSIPISITENNAVFMLPPSAWQELDSMEFLLSHFTDKAALSMIDSNIVIHHTRAERTRQSDLIFTELMIESEDAPEWVEVLNTSDYAVQIEDLNWFDGSTSILSELIPLGSWNGVIPPKNRAVIIISSEAHSFSHPYLAIPSNYGTLNNSGETISIIKSDGAVICELSYSTNWKSFESESLLFQKRYLTNCNIENNWTQIEPISQSPGQSNPIEFNPLSADSLNVTVQLPWGLRQGKIEFNQPLHPNFDPQSTGAFAWVNDEQPSCLNWILDQNNLLSGTPTISHVQGCYTENTLEEPWPIDFSSYRIPETGDVLISEIAHDPSGLSNQWGQFVELVNPSLTDTIELTGCSVNSFTIDFRKWLLPGERFCIQSIVLGKEYDRVLLSNPMGEVIDEVNYRRCWHRDRSKAQAGYSLIRINCPPQCTESNSWRNWDSSSEFNGCSYGSIDAGESHNGSSMKAKPPVCGVWNDRRLLLFDEPIELNPAHWEMVSTGSHGSWFQQFEHGTIWIAQSDTLELVQEFCPSLQNLSGGMPLIVNEVRKLNTGGPEPFIELANGSSEWVFTEHWFWTTDWIPFPNDWTPVSEPIHWFIPPFGAVALAECPNRIESPTIVLPAALPSLWSDFTLLLANREAVIDSTHIHPELRAPWHTSAHSLERIENPLAQSMQASWNSSLDPSGHSAGKLNSWQITPSFQFTNCIRVIQDTWSYSPLSFSQPVCVEIHPPGPGTWSIHAHIYDAFGLQIHDFDDRQWTINEQHSEVIQWSGQHQSSFVAPGAYMLEIIFQSHQDMFPHRVSLPIHVSPF